MQRVHSAHVDIDGKRVAGIGKGYLLLVGFGNDDQVETIAKMAKKVVQSRLFEDENGKTNLSLAQIEGEILSVSQFTLYANMKEGNRPSFVDAMAPEKAKGFYAIWNEKLREYGIKVHEGVFGADMKVTLLNDGPFTIIFDSDELFKRSER